MQDLILKRVFILLGLATAVWVLLLLKPVILPFVVAFILAYLFSPLVNYLRGWGVPRWLAISAVFIGIGLVVSLAVSYFVPLVWEQLMYAKDKLPAAIIWVNNNLIPWLSSTFKVNLAALDVNQLTSDILAYLQTNYSSDSVQDLIYRLAQSGLSVIQVGGTIVLVPIIAFYFLLDWDGMLEKLRRLIPRRQESKVIQITQECHQVLGAFIRGQLLVMILLGTVYALGLQLIGIQVGLIIGMVAGLCSIIPYLGFAVGILAAVIASLLQYGLDWVHLLLVAIVFLIGQIIEGYILQPFLLGDRIGLSPVAVVFAVLAGAQLAGIAGMLLALPLAAVLVVLLRHLYDAYQHSAFYGAYPAVTTNHIASTDFSGVNLMDDLDQQIQPDVNLESIQQKLGTPQVDLKPSSSHQQSRVDDV